MSVESGIMNLLEMYERARGAEIIPVAATVLPYNTASTREASKIRELNRWIRNKTKNLSIPFCDTNGAVADSENPDRLRASPDGLHPDVSGYRAMAVRIGEAIELHLSARRRNRTQPPGAWLIGDHLNPYQPTRRQRNSLRFS